MQAMILAAGFGTRLLPYTEKKPKPLFPLLNTPLLHIAIEKLVGAGFNRIIINTHHLREQFKTIPEKYPRVILQKEEKILGTGGGLRWALKNLRDEPLLIMNGDIYHTIDPMAIYQHHLHNHNRVTLAVHDYPRFNTLEMKEGRLIGFYGQGTVDALAFTGIHVIDPQVLETLPMGEKTCIIQRYAELLHNKERISLFRTDKFFWSDMGTPHDYLALHGGILQGKIPHWASRPAQRNKRAIISDGADIGKNLKIKDWASIGKASIGDNVTIVRSVIWDGARISSNATLTDAIITQ